MKMYPNGAPKWVTVGPPEVSHWSLLPPECNAAGAPTSPLRCLPQPMGHTLPHVTHLYTCIPIYLYTYIPTYLYTYMPIYLYTRTPIHLYTYTPIHLYTYTPIYVYTYSPIYLYTYIPVYLYTNI